MNEKNTPISDLGELSDDEMQRNVTPLETTKPTLKTTNSEIILQSIAKRKTDLIAALQKSMGVATQACEMVGCDRATYYEYLREDPAFAAAVADVKNIALDFAESKLFKNIESQDPASIFFFLKTQGKARGYIERTEQRIQVEDLSGKSDAELLRMLNEKA